MGGMNDLVQWLRAQLDTDAKAAEPYAEKAVHARDCDVLPDGDRVTYPCNCGVPERLLREIDAKRRILAEHALNGWVCSTCDNGDVGQVFPCPTLRLLALPYSDRPGYCEDWKP